MKIQFELEDVQLINQAFKELTQMLMDLQLRQPPSMFPAIKSIERVVDVAFKASLDSPLKRV